MGRLFPSLKEIEKNNIKITEGEKALLEFLYKELSNAYEIYFKPNINGDKPQIVILREKYGMVLLGVKEWELEDYYIDEKNTFRKKGNFNVFKSPFQQIREYKNNFYDLHSEMLLQESIQNDNIYTFIKCGVYFHNENMGNVRRKFMKKNIQWDDVEIIGNDSLRNGNLKEFLTKKSMQNSFEGEEIISKKIYTHIRKLMKTNIHIASYRKNISYSNRQIRLMISKEESKKIKGVAGSGKTLILANRAVNANIRTKSKVLILTNNITLKDYIYRKINSIGKEFNLGDFEINNYNSFIKFQLNNLEIPFSWNNDFSHEELEKYLEIVKDRIERYKAIFIDEVQDFKIGWLRIIKKYFLEKKGEYVLFGDEKQNIYMRKLEENKTTQTNIKGAWNLLDQSFRLPMKLAILAVKFQKKFLSTKYNIDDINTFNIQTSIWDDGGKVEYAYFEIFNSEEIFSHINSIMLKNDIKCDEICIIGTSIEKLKKIDLYIRTEKGLETEIAFESEEEYFKTEKEIMGKCKSLREEGKNSRLLRNEIVRIREGRKYNFRIENNKLKLAPIESFKGLEMRNLIIIVDDTIDSSDELIYTGITRCTNKLFFINIGNEKYDGFFTSILT